MDINTVDKKNTNNGSMLVKILQFLLKFGAKLSEITDWLPRSPNLTVTDEQTLQNELKFIVSVP